MATIKSFTDLSKSKALAKILPLESADMWYHGHYSPWESERKYDDEPCPFHSISPTWDKPCWGLAALLKCLSKIKPQVYTPILFPSEGKWILQFAEHGHGNVYEVSCDNPVDACYEMILKLNEFNLL